MKEKLLTRLIVAALVLIFIVYIGYQIIIGTKKTVETIDAAVFSVEDRFTVSGVFIRSERQIREPSGAASEMIYLHKNGERISAGQQLAVYFQTESSYEAYKNVERVEQELKSLTAAYERLGSAKDYAGLDTSIYEQISGLNAIIDSCSCEAIPAGYADLSQLVVTRVGSLTEEEFKTRSEKLLSEKAGYSASIHGESRVYADGPGYFVNRADGYENAVDYTKVASLSYDDILAIKDKRLEPSADTVGVMITEYRWYYAAPMSLEQYNRISSLKTVKLIFPGLGGAEIELAPYKVNSSDENGKVAVIFRSSVMDPEFLSARWEDAEVSVSSIKGVYIPREALRQLDGKWGVYCMEGRVFRFKEVEILYTTDTYYLAKQAQSSVEGVYPGDKLVISGKNLDSGRVIK